jgi:hypothetical protein
MVNMPVERRNLEQNLASQQVVVSKFAAIHEMMHNAWQTKDSYWPIKARQKTTSLIGV